MFATTILCDQAVFTSVRTPMGEGYRIIAASRGLRPDEKQAITRSSPSHDALCQPADDGRAGADDARDGEVLGVAFYKLPRGRLCAALSCWAGAEHTGRGGQRVYTHNLVFDVADFPRCGLDPFTVFRAMIEAGLASPQLRPPPVLPELPLAIRPTEPGDVTLGPAVSPACARDILHRLLLDRALIVNIDRGWISVAEALLLGVPGPMRHEISFSAGLRFSVGRCHRLSLVCDDQNVIRSRIAGRSIEYVAPSNDDASDGPTTEWLRFVERHWRRGDLAGLARRTSRDFVATTPEVRERVARMYNQADAVRDTETRDLLQNAEHHLTQPGPPQEADIVAKLLEKTGATIADRWTYAAWEKVKPHWPAVCSLWRQAGDARRFARPLVEKSLRAAFAEHPIVAAEATLELVRRTPPIEWTPDDTRLIDGTLNRIAQWAESAAGPALERLPNLCRQWQTVRPRCPIIERIHRRCSSPATR